MMLSCAVLALSCAWAAHAQEQVHDAAGVPYVSGGVGEQSRAWMQERAADYNLHVVFATRSGAYLSGVEVSIIVASGAVVLSTVAQGPWLYARLPPGAYEMRATLNAVTQRQAFTVPARGSRRLVFRWSDEP